PAYALDFGPGGSSPVVGVRPITGSYTDPTVYTLDGGACVGQPTSQGAYWTVGPPVDPDGVFARVTIQTE
ncbi:MAG: hypothetical protein JST54_35580, partial [Deltaproteobacteria bacterium]|nr:hypothetical protein [Deltaproteobacteria bacterium]